MAGLCLECALSDAVCQDLKNSEDACVSTAPGGWTDLMAVYARSALVEQNNRAAAEAFASQFLTPTHLMSAAQLDPRLEVKELASGVVLVRTATRSSFEALKLRKALSGVLRYDAADWLSLRALVPLAQRRLGQGDSDINFGTVYIALASDPRRYELQLWEGQWWARATYRRLAKARAARQSC